jgi:hypothetical protein
VPAKQSIGDAFGDLDAALPVSPLASLSSVSYDEPPKVDVLAASREPPREAQREPVVATRTAAPAPVPSSNALPRSNSSLPAATVGGSSIHDQESVSPTAAACLTYRRVTWPTVSSP